jgi:hypothetical protein
MPAQLAAVATASHPNQTPHATTAANAMIATTRTCRFGRRLFEEERSVTVRG